MTTGAVADPAAPLFFMESDKRKQSAFYLFYAGLLLLVVSLPLSKFTMSIAQFMIVGGWLLDGNIRGKLQKFITTPLAWLPASVYVLHVVGLLYSSDTGYALKDLRVKLPLLLMPLLLVAAPEINRKRFEYLLFALIGGVVVSTFISWLIYLGVIHRPVNDIRDICIFISHIRLALLCCLSVFCSFWLIREHRYEGTAYMWIFVPVMLWLVYFLVLIESLTGILILVTGALLLGNWLVFQGRGKLYRTVSVIITLAIPMLIIGYVSSVNRMFSTRHIETGNLEKFTPSGNPYEHFSDRNEFENGYPIWNYVSEDELRREWQKRSALDYSGRDRRGQELRVTLIRYLSSKGLRKDSSGVWSLDAEEIGAVEAGVTNVVYLRQGSIRSRVHQVLWELHNYRRTGDPSGHSVAQRLEFWKAGFGIFRQHFLLGVGTGDVPDAFDHQYKEMNSKLRPEWRLRAHNQYLSIGVAFGSMGLTWFLLTLLYPLVLKIRQSDFLYVSFSIISLLSMLTEDTLETQAGVTFFALFTSLFLLVNPRYRPTRGN